MSDSLSNSLKSKLNRLAAARNSNSNSYRPRSVRGFPKSNSNYSGMPEFRGNDTTDSGATSGATGNAILINGAEFIVDPPLSSNSNNATGSSEKGSSLTPAGEKERGRKRSRNEVRGGNNNKDNDGGEEANKPLAVGVIPSITLDDMGGLKRELPLIRELIDLPIQRPNLFASLGADPPCGVLLHGPPGCGKTKLVHAIAGSLKVPLFFVSAPEIVTGIAGDSEAKLRTLFMDAISVAPSIVFIDEIDTIAGSRDGSQTPMGTRIVGQLLSCMDQVSHSWTEYKKVVCVMGATNRIEAIDGALRRAGRFDRELPLGIPSLDERIEILKVVTKKLNLEADVDYFQIANMTPGFVGADLHLLVKEACIVAIRRKHLELEANQQLDNPNSDLLANFAVTFNELKEATRRVQPSAMREGFTTIPNVTWDDVGALEDVRANLMAAVLRPIRTPKLHKRFGLDNPIGVLLYGPPGCGKTLVAKAIANESGANFISIKGPELLNKFVGESERSVRMVFARGRASAPCVLFFDELDALAPRRGGDRTNPSSERVVNQILTEMDGVEGRKNVFVIGATNRPDIIDPAMLRPGRLDKLMYVPLPSPSQRLSILQTIAKKYPLGDEVDLKIIANDKRLEGFSGADLAALMREASLSALKTVYDNKTPEELVALEKDGDRLLLSLKNSSCGEDACPTSMSNAEAMSTVDLPTVGMDHFELALDTIKPSVSEEERKHYLELHKRLSSDNARI